MSKWRELKYYAHGTPTKAALKDRRRHLFIQAKSGVEKSPCGLLVFENRFSEGPTDVPKCGHCIKYEMKNK